MKPKPAIKEVEVNGVRLQYLDQGSGEPVVFVHGVISDHRAWEPVRDEIARKYRFIALTQRYFGIGAWKDDGTKYSVATFSDDLAKFITSLDVGPVHLVGWWWWWCCEYQRNGAGIVVQHRLERLRLDASVRLVP